MKCFFIISSIVSLISFANCDTGIDRDELWREKVTLDDGSHIMVYHSHKCNKSKPFFCKTEKISEYRKMKNDVFDFCVDEYEGRIVNLYSRQNIKDIKEAFSAGYFSGDDYNYYKGYIMLLDETDRLYQVGYSLKDDNLKRLSKWETGASLCK